MIITAPDYNTIVSVEDDFVLEIVTNSFDYSYSIMIQTKMQKERVFLGAYDDLDRAQRTMSRLQRAVENRENFIMPNNEEASHA